MEWLFSWGVTSVVALGFMFIGLSVLQMDDFKLAKLFFLLAAADAIGGVAMAGTNLGSRGWTTNLIVFCAAGAVGFLALQSFRYVDRKKAAKEKPPVDHSADRNTPSGSPSAASPTPKPNVKPAIKPKPGQPTIQIAPSFGNLQNRTLDLADKIDKLVQHRFDQKTKYPNPPTPESLTEWNRSNDVEFSQCCWEELKSIHEEFATLHIRDEQLDRIVLKYEESLQRRNSEPQTQWWSTYMNIFDMQSIARTLRILASQLSK